MKQPVVSIIFLVILIVFFVIVDRKEFNGNDKEDIQTVQREESLETNKNSASVINTGMNATSGVKSSEADFTSNIKIASQPASQPARQTEGNS